MGEGERKITNEEINNMTIEEFFSMLEEENNNAFEKVKEQKNSFSEETYRRLLAEGELLEFIYKEVRKSNKFEEDKNMKVGELLKKIDGK